MLGSKQRYLEVLGGHGMKTDRFNAMGALDVKNAMIVSFRFLGVKGTILLSSRGSLGVKKHSNCELSEPLDMKH